MARNEAQLYESQYNCGRYIDLNDKEAEVRYYVSQMINETLPCFEYDGLPDTIPKRDLEIMEFTGGFVGITKVSVVDGEGKIDLENGKPYAFFGGLGGEYNAYYYPTVLVVANPYLKLNAKLTVDKDVVIIPNDSMYLGLLPLFNHYATMLTETEISLRIACINSRIQKLISAGDNRSIASAKKYIEDIEKGKLGVVADSAFLDGVRAQSPSNGGDGHTITQLIELKQYYRAGWRNDIGLDANYNMKRESINSTEAQLGNDALLPRIDDMYNCRVNGWKKANELLGLNVSVRRGSAWKIREELTEQQVEDGTLELTKSTEAESGAVENG